jgi:hypothetical protein
VSLTLKKLCQKGACSACSQDEDSHVVRRLYHIRENAFMRHSERAKNSLLAETPEKERFLTPQTRFGMTFFSVPCGLDCMFWPWEGRILGVTPIPPA